MTTFATLDFSFDNPVLAPLESLTPPAGKDSLDIQISKLPDSMANPLKAVYKSLTAKDLREDTVVFRLVFKEDKSPKLYSPAIYSQEGTLVLRWGQEIIPLSLKKSSLTPVEALFEGVEYSATIDKVKIGQYKESVVNFTISDFEGYDEIVMPLVLKGSNWELKQDDFLASAKVHLKKGNVEELVGMIYELKSSGGSYSNNPLVSNDDLPQGVDLLIIKSRKVETKFGTNYVLTARANPEIGLEQDVDFFGFSQIRKKLNSGAFIDSDNPATLNFVKGTNEREEVRYKISFDVKWSENENTLSLSEVLANWE
jgi:hypothetical protein